MENEYPPNSGFNQEILIQSDNDNDFVRKCRDFIRKSNEERYKQLTDREKKEYEDMKVTHPEIAARRLGIFLERSNATISKMKRDFKIRKQHGDLDLVQMQSL